MQNKVTDKEVASSSSSYYELLLLKWLILLTSDLPFIQNR